MLSLAKSPEYFGPLHADWFFNIRSRRVNLWRNRSDEWATKSAAAPGARTKANKECFSRVIDRSLFIKMHFFGSM